MKKPCVIFERRDPPGMYILPIFPYILDGVESKVSLVHKDDANWFLTLDKTHHEFLTARKKGSALNGRWVSELFPRSGERNIVGNFHTTGVYDTTLVGKALVPLYILSTTSSYLLSQVSMDPTR
jgi:hypothetical protein